MKRIQTFKSYNEKQGLWDNVHDKKKRGEAAAKPGDEDYPEADAIKDAQESVVESDLNEGTDLGSWNQGGPGADKNVLVTKYVGPKDVEEFGLGRSCMQINVGQDYIQLNPADIVELKELLKSYKVK